MLTAAEIYLRVRDTLQDVAGTRWLTAELDRYLIDGQVSVVEKCPSRGLMSYITMPMVAGPVQGISGYITRILDVMYNQTSGGVRGRAIRKISKDQLDAQRPNWPAETQSATIMYWMPIEGEPADFLVYPPATTAASVRIKYVQTPTSTAIEVDDACRDALYHYIVARCWDKDATYATKAAEHWKLFYNEIDLIHATDKMAMGVVQQRNPPR